MPTPHRNVENKQAETVNPTLPKCWKEAKLDNKQTKAEQRKRQLKNGRRALYNSILMHFF